MRENKIALEESFVEMDGFKIFTKFYGNNQEKPTIVMDSGYGTIQRLGIT